MFSENTNLIGDSTNMYANIDIHSSDIASTTFSILFTYNDSDRKTLENGITDVMFFFEEDLKSKQYETEYCHYMKEHKFCFYVNVPSADEYTIKNLKACKKARIGRFLIFGKQTYISLHMCSATAN